MQFDSLFVVALPLLLVVKLEHVLFDLEPTVLLLVNTPIVFATSLSFDENLRRCDRWIIHVMRSDFRLQWLLGSTVVWLLHGAVGRTICTGGG